MFGGEGVLLGERGVTEREFTVDWLGISCFLLYVGLHSRGIWECIVRGTGSDGKGIYRGLGGISIWRGWGCVCFGVGGCVVRGMGSDVKGICRGLGGFRGGIGAERSGLERSEAKRSGEA